MLKKIVLRIMNVLVVFGECLFFFFHFLSCLLIFWFFLLFVISTLMLMLGLLILRLGFEILLFLFFLIGSFLSPFLSCSFYSSIFDVSFKFLNSMLRLILYPYPLRYIVYIFYLLYKACQIKLIKILNLI